MPDVLKTAQVAERLQVSVKTARAWLRERQVPVVRVGRCVRYRLVDIERAEADAVELERRRAQKRPRPRVARLARSTRNTRSNAERRRKIVSGARGATS